MQTEARPDPSPPELLRVIARRLTLLYTALGVALAVEALIRAKSA